MSAHPQFSYRLLPILGLAMALFGLYACSDPNQPSGAGSRAGSGTAVESGARQARIAFVPNNASAFWQIARKGTEKAAEDFNCIVEFRAPAQGTAAEQQSILEDLLVKGVDGIAISPVDPISQVELLNTVAQQTNLICHDSDSPDSNRLCYVGTDNFKAGIEAGKLIEEAMPEGGKIMIYVGMLDAQNARERYEGIKKELEGGNIEIVDVLTDNTDRVRAQTLVEDTLVTKPDITCLVGLWSYNGPVILSAVTDAGKSITQGGNIKIVCFDEDDDTLQGITDGAIYGTVVQKPYAFGYESVRLLNALARGDKSVIPESKHVDPGVVIVRKDNVETFWTTLKRQLGKS